MKSNLKKGFTLIELLVVIVIIGILATIGVAQFSSYFSKARDAKRVTAMQQAQSIIMAYAASDETSSFPADAEAAEAEMSRNGFTLVASSDDPYKYYYAHDPVAKEFALVVCSEEDATAPFVKGSLDTATITCTDGAATSTMTGAALEEIVAPTS